MFGIIVPAARITCMQISCILQDETKSTTGSRTTQLGYTIAVRKRMVPCKGATPMHDIHTKPPYTGIAYLRKYIIVIKLYSTYELKAH